jgi:hypothetical protein
MRNERAANYLCHQTATIDTRDHEDHTFSGIMFSIRSKTSLPVDFIEVTALWVRGRLGPLTVWTTGGDFRERGVHEQKEKWELLHNCEHSPSFQQLQELQFDQPLRIRPDDQQSLYVHSQLQSDEGVVYDNQRSAITLEDEFLQVLPGIAHLSAIPFSPVAWGWGTWRDRRVFVGRVSYNIRYLLWSPNVHMRYNRGFRNSVRTMLMCQRREGCPVSILGDDCLCYILNFCGAKWFPDADPPLLTIQGSITTAIKQLPDVCGFTDMDQWFTLAAFCIVGYAMWLGSGPR